MQSNPFRPLLVALLLTLLAPGVFADDICYRIGLHKLQITAGTLPQPGNSFTRFSIAQAMTPYVRLDQPGEAYCVDTEKSFNPNPAFFNHRYELFIRTPLTQDITGKIFLPNSAGDGMVAVTFILPAKTVAPVAPREFLPAKIAYYDSLVARQLPGSAWFRYQADEARKTLGTADNPHATNNDRPPTDPTDETYGLFTGGRALSENLQLNRSLRAIPNASEKLIDIKDIPGITIREMDWTPLIKDKHPDLDPLASFIPADQHAIFFPTFSAFVNVADETDRAGTPIAQLIEPRSEDAGAKARYQRQLCLSLTGLGRLLGPQMVNSVAITGSDPYLRVGSDLTIIFQAKDPAALQKMLTMQIAVASQLNPQAKTVSGKIAGIDYTGALSPDRTISSYLIALGDAVIVSNSLPQLEHLTAVHQKREPSLASLPEYTFFRDRYKRGEADESALVILSDATIRRWCGPKWRIADSRRTRAAAIMSAYQAQYVDQLVKNTVAPGPIPTDRTDLGELAITSTGVNSSIYGGLDFMTPIVELDLDKVSSAEGQSYGRWRDTYQQNWSQYFDPIAIRLSMNDKHLSADMTVTPLIARTEYATFIELSKGVKLADAVTDAHDSIAHWTLAINKDSTPIRNLNNLGQNFGGNVNLDLLGWLGKSISVYADDDPYWNEAAKSPDPEKYVSTNTAGLPVAISIDVSNPLKLAVFMASARLFIETASPRLTTWTPVIYKTSGYVRIDIDETLRRALAGNEAPNEKLAVFYAALPDQLVISFNETVVQHAIDRHCARVAAKLTSKELPPPAHPFLGQSAALQFQGSFASVASRMFSSQIQSQFQLRAWANIPILNEYKRLYPNQDPIKLHEKLWGTKLLCPGGGSYVWNEKWQTMESTVYGHPAEPKPGPALPPALQGFSFGNFGVDFENNGLRARVELEKVAK